MGTFLGVMSIVFGGILTIVTLRPFLRIFR